MEALHSINQGKDAHKIYTKKERAFLYYITYEKMNGKFV